MLELNPHWYKVADDVAALSTPANPIAVAEVGGKKVCVAKYRDQYFAFAYSCPHAGGIMANGFIDALGNVVCPLHRYKFSLKNGYNVTGEGYKLKTYPVEIRNDGVYVALEQ